MKKTILIIITGIFAICLISGQTTLTIYLDETGTAKFIGETGEQASLPQGIVKVDGKLSGQTTELTRKEGKDWFFSYNLEESDIVVVLPSDAILNDVSEGEIYLKGDRIAIYNKDSIDFSYYLESPNEPNYLIFYIMIILIIFAGIILYFYKFRKQPKRIENKIILETLKATLNDRQKRIVEKLQEVKEIKHSRLQKLVEMPKASFSRHVQELEKKGIILRKGEGKNKTLSLK